MPDLEQRMRGIDRLAFPDLWERAEIEALERQPAIRPSPAHRVAIVAAALAVSAAVLSVLWVAFRSDPNHRPVTPPIPVTNGDIWVLVSGDEWPELAIYRVDPAHVGDLEATWTNSPQVFPDARNAPALVASDYAFSPDGSQVAFSAGAGSRHAELFVMNADGSGLRQLTHDGGYSSSPAWSPDGSMIAYARSSALFNPSDLFVIGAGGGASTPMVAETGVSEQDPSWSPDGTRIAFTVVDIRGLDSIVSMRQDGADRMELARGRVSSPAWSPDGTSIAFFRKYDGSAHIWTIARDGSGARDLVDTGTMQVSHPLWSPDGSSIAFARSPGGKRPSLWLIDATRITPPERLAGWPGFSAWPVAWQPVVESGSSPMASP